MADTSSFSGFTKETVRFFEGLKRNNTREWFTAHRETYDKHVLEPAKAFVVVMGGKLRTAVPRIVAVPQVNRSLGKALAGLNAQSKGRRLGIFKPAEGPEEARKVSRGEEMRIVLLGRPVPARNTEEGVRALNGDKVIASAGVERYLESKFGDRLDSVRKAMKALAAHD